MWIEDLTKALWMLNGSNLKWMARVFKISNGVIYLTNGATFEIKELVKQYNKEYGE